MRARVVVIGGGVMGVSIAWHLARRLDPHTDPVVLLEKSELAAGSSGRSGAIVRQFYGDRVVAGMARDSLRVFAGFERRTGRAIGFMPSGVLTIGSRSNPDEAGSIEANVAMMRDIGIDVELVDAAGVRRIAPQVVADDATIAAWEPTAGAVDPLLTVQAFAALAREAGVVTRLGRRAEELVVRAGRVVGVHIQDAVIECEQVVLAAGPWTSAWLARLGVELPLRVVRPMQQFFALPDLPGSDEHRKPLQIVVGARPDDMRPGDMRPGDARVGSAPAERTTRAEMLARLASSNDRELPHAPHPILLDLEHGFYARCDMLAERTRVGHLDYGDDAEVLDPDAVDDEVSDSFRRWARARLAKRVPVYAERPEVASFTGMYTLTPDSQAVLGPVAGRDGPIDSLFVACGFSGHGFKLSPSVGEGVAQMVLGEPVSAFDPEFFALNRFARGVKKPRAFGL